MLLPTLAVHQDGFNVKELDGLKPEHEVSDASVLIQTQ